MIISVHIPKTGGRTFRSLLEAHFEDRLFLDYADQPMKKKPFLRNLSAVCRIPQARSRAKQFDCIHGHFLPVKYICSGMDNQFVTWFREPVEREISRYYYWKRQPGGFANKVNIKNKDISLEEFCRLKCYHNFYTNYLWMFDIKKFSFIGITENYDNSINLFKCMFDVDESLLITRGNINPEKMTVNYDIDNDLRNYIREVNQKDYMIYHEAIQINEQLQKEYS